MAVIAQFGELKFEISSSAALLFQGLKMSAECETAEQTGNSQQYVSAKNGKAVQISLSIILNAALGIDVKMQATDILNTAQRGGQGYFYIGGAKVFPFKLMMTKADTEEIAIDPSGRWISTKINVTLKQSTKEWIIGQAQDVPSPSGSTIYTPQKASVNTRKPVGLILSATAGAVALLQSVKKAQDSVAKSSAAEPSTAAAVAAQRKTTSTAKTTKSTVKKTGAARKVRQLGMK